MIEQADIRHDLDVTPWPFADDSVDEAYSCHCIEHLQRGPWPFLRELARVCKIGAPVEIRCPSPGSDLASQWGHTHVFSHIEVMNGQDYFRERTWPGPKWLRCHTVRYEPSVLMPRAKEQLPFLKGLDDQIIMTWFPRTAHECRYYYTCERLT
jgi:SAM-dependent methyltransferase